jgi:phosphomevalonate kinase
MLLYHCIAKALWDELHSYNTKVEQDLRELNTCFEQDQQTYNQAIDRLAVKKASEVNWLFRTVKLLLWYLYSQHMFMQWKSLDSLDEVQEKLLRLYENFENVRRLIRDMSEKSNVPIEPSEQTKLLDACMGRPGVIMAGVPGGDMSLELLPPR